MLNLVKLRGVCAIIHELLLPLKYDFLTHNVIKFDILASFNFFMKQNKNYITINDCLEYQRFIKNDQNIKCTNCTNSSQLVSSKIYLSPNIFIFLLNRNIFQDLINVRFCLQDKINLNKYIEKSGGPTNYELTGIISIYVKKKIYISCCKSPVDKHWYYYENEIIGETDINKVINNNNNNLFLPCLLVYKSSK